MNQDLNLGSLILRCLILNQAALLWLGSSHCWAGNEFQVCWRASFSPGRNFYFSVPLRYFYMCVYVYAVNLRQGERRMVGAQKMLVNWRKRETCLKDFWLERPPFSSPTSAHHLLHPSAPWSSLCSWQIFPPPHMPLSIWFFSTCPGSTFAHGTEWDLWNRYFIE